MKKLLMWLPLALLLNGCTDAEKANLFSLGSKHKIQLFSGNACIGTWESTGALNDVAGDGCDFMDDSTHKLITLRGTMVITQE